MIPRKILNIEVGNKCNNNCIFCSDSQIKSLDKNRIKAKILSSKENKIIFVQKEPTLNNELIEYIRMAKNRRFKTIALSTNARMLSYPKYTKKIISAGLNEITISIHGPKKIHEALTRTPGSYRQTLEGLKNASKFDNINLISATTITSKNLKYIPQLMDILKPHNLDLHVFNILAPKGRGKMLFNKMAPDFDQIEEIFLKLDKNIKLNMPPCSVPRLKEFIGIPELNLAAEDNPVCKKHQKCNKCYYNSYCKGFYKEYIELFGWNFEPI
ncbi:MAG: radical SAM protein [bacterium]